MDALIYEKKSKKVIAMFKNAKIYAEFGKLDNRYEYKTMENYDKYIEEKPNGDILFIDVQKPKSKILYLDDYREKPY